MIFNTNKTIEDYKSNKVFLTGDVGLLNTIHKSYPEIWNKRDEIKSLDWHENEFNYTQCVADFKLLPSDISNAMIDTIAWQWEADSIASTNPAILIAPFQPCLEVFATEMQVAVNEILHATTYSEIVRLSFDNPEEVLKDILNNQQSFKRLDIINKELGNFQQFSKDYMLQPELYSERVVLENLLKFYFVLYILERIQFIASFAITFTIVHSGSFQAIGQAVRKIAQDELQVHVGYRQSVINAILKQLGVDKLSVYKDMLLPILDEVVQSEIDWSRHIMGKYKLPALQEKGLIDWVKYNANSAYEYLTGEIKFHDCKSNPLPHLSVYFDNDSVQSAVQEIASASYVLNSVVEDNLDDVDFNF